MSDPISDPQQPGATLPPTELPIPSGISWELPEPAPAEDDGDQLEDAQLFGATFTPGGFVPVPVVTVGGVEVARGTTAGQISGQMVVDGISVRWGRERVLSQAEPSTAQLVLFDATGTWATSRQLIGQVVTIGWTGVLGGTGPVSGLFFRGRIQRVKLARKTVRQADGTRVKGALLTLPLVSILNDLANVTPRAAWPEETVAARRDRLAAYTTVVAPGGIVVRAFWLTPNAEPVAVTNQRTVWDHVVALYDSTGADRMAHYPADGTIRNMVRKDYSVRGLAGLWWDQVSDPELPGRAGQGAYLRTYSVAPVGGGGVGGTPSYLYAAALEDEPGESLSQGPEQRVSRVAVTHRSNPSMASRTVTRVIPTVDEPTEGIRQVSVDSVLTWDAYVDTAASDLQEVASQEARGWQIPPLVWDTRRTGGFDTFGQAALHLIGGEDVSIVFLQRSWLPRFGLRPIYGVMGGTISYQRGHWRLELNAQPLVTSQYQHAISWEEIDDGSATYQVQLWDTPNPRGLHESLSVDDLAYCSTGVGVVTIPPDSGFDRMITP